MLTALLKNYLILAARNLLKHKLYSFINIVGLAIGISSFSVLTLVIRKELAYDNSHLHHERIYRIASNVQNASKVELIARTPYLLAPNLQRTCDEDIEKTVRVFDYKSPISPIKYKDTFYNEKGFLFVDSTFFEVFHYNFIEGTINALQDSNAVVISEAVAQKYFGKESAIGKEIYFQGVVKLTVRGVIANEQAPSHIKANLLCSMSTLYTYPVLQRLNNWHWNAVYTYIRCKKTISNTDKYNQKINELLQEDSILTQIKDNKLFLQPLTDIHLYSHLEGELENNGDIRFAFILGAIALLIALIAIINYTNLTTAKYTMRAREVAVRKMLGADGNELVLQFMTESLLLTLFAVLLALVFFEIMMAGLSEILVGFMALPGKDEIALPTFVIGLVIGVISGIYPALNVASFNPLNAIRGKMMHISGTQTLRKILLVMQFVITTFLLAITTVNFSQIIFMRSTKVGFDKTNILLIPISHTQLFLKYDFFKHDLLQIQGVEHVTCIENIIGEEQISRPYRYENNNQTSLYYAMFVRPDFLKTFRIELIAGRYFQTDYPILPKTDSVNLASNNADDTVAVIVNREMTEFLGLKSPQDAIGKSFRSENGREKIIGVVENFHFHSLHQPLMPFVLDMPSGVRDKFLSGRYIAVRLNNSQTTQQTTSAIENLWKIYLPQVPFESHFLEERLEKAYFHEERLAKISAYFTEVAILVACMGLFGLASFFASSKRHEIGIRKTLGASFWEITWLLVKFFAPLVLMSIILGNLMAYFAAKQWLESFAYHVSNSFVPYLLSSLTVIFFSMIVVGFHAIRAALTNPIDDLKN